MKVCSSCKESSLVVTFGRNRSTLDGLQYRCKLCVNAASNEVGTDGLTKGQRGKRKVGPDGLTSGLRSSRKVGPDGLTASQRQNRNVGLDGLTSSQRSKKKIGADGLTGAQRSDRKQGPGGRRDSHLRRHYGVSLELFNALLKEQDGACAICRRADAKCIDHDHSTGEIRGILCSQCNTAIGLLQDSARITSAAAKYLTKHGKT